MDDRWIGTIIFNDTETQYFFFYANDMEEAEQIFDRHVNSLDLDDDNINFYEIVNFGEMEEIDC